jgi:DNA-binding transcriptional ArsR family regulator
MDEDILESYEIETVEQLRAVADERRVRIVSQLAVKSMTVTQLAELLGEPPNKVHYHVRELERVGMLKQVETREKGGILEKYYRAIAKSINASQKLLGGMPPDEAIVMFNDLLQPFIKGLTQAAQRTMESTAEDREAYVVQFSPSHLWMTKKEYTQLSKQIRALLEQYEQPRGIEGEHEQTILWLSYPTALAKDQQESNSTALPTSSKPSKQELEITIGIVHYDRKDLEAVVVRGESLNLYVLGSCTFAEDIPPKLVEQAISGFHLKGKLNASPTVREVLKYKGGEVGKNKP